jgi:hypothetical protein
MKVQTISTTCIYPCGEEIPRGWNPPAKTHVHRVEVRRSANKEATTSFVFF